MKKRSEEEECILPSTYSNTTLRCPSFSARGYYQDKNGRNGVTVCVYKLALYMMWIVLYNMGISLWAG